MVNGVDEYVCTHKELRGGLASVGVSDGYRDFEVAVGVV